MGLVQKKAHKELAVKASTVAHFEILRTRTIAFDTSGPALRTCMRYTQESMMASFTKGMITEQIMSVNPAKYLPCSTNRKCTAETVDFSMSTIEMPKKLALAENNTHVKPGMSKM